jgi:hypothetical protein
VVAVARNLALIGQGVMDITGIRVSVRQIKRNIAKLKKKDPKTKKINRAIEKAERNLAKRLSILDEIGVSEKFERKPRKKKLTSFGFGDYNKYISSKEWAARKASYYETHHKECRSCGTDEEEIHLHHRSYARIYQEEDGDLIPMCVDCHAMLHKFQRSMKLPVEDATRMWLSATNGTSKKKKIRAALRSMSFKSFEGLWAKRSKLHFSPEQHLEKTIERIVKGDLGSRNDLLQDHAGFKKSIALAGRTGVEKFYDARVDALIRKLERQ